MEGFLIWGAFTTGVAAFCVWRPQAARIFVGLFFVAMALGVHGGLIATALILGRGRAVTWGLLAAIVFLLGITPLGLEELPNVVLAAGLAFLLTQDFPTDLWTMVRRHRRPRPAIAGRPAESPSAPSPERRSR
ncbi:MAG: hypothetical protein Q8Q02_00570 [Nocardioides sp.]|nr:hypothetical protein [Nocardioides sp.]